MLLVGLAHDLMEAFFARRTRLLDIMLIIRIVAVGGEVCSSKPIFDKVCDSSQEFCLLIVNWGTIIWNDSPPPKPLC